MNAMLETQILSGGISIGVARAKPLPALFVEPRPERSKARDAALIYAENRLSMWSKWAKENRESIGYPTISTLYRAMATTKVGIMRGSAPLPKEVGEGDNRHIEYPINAEGSATRSLRPPTVGEVPEAIAEVDTAVAKLPKDLHTVIVADYFTYGSIEDRCKRTPWRRARYSQLLESAKYAVYVALMG